MGNHWEEFLIDHISAKKEDIEFWCGYKVTDRQTI